VPPRFDAGVGQDLLDAFLHDRHYYRAGADWV
jgi:hypothetical protein